jgi:hypothetical protein
MIFPNNQMVNTSQELDKSFRRWYVITSLTSRIKCFLHHQDQQWIQQCNSSLQLRCSPLQNFTTTVQNMQAHQNQPPPHAPPPPPNKPKEFMSHHPPTYSHSVDPLDADDWLKTINKMIVRRFYMPQAVWKVQHLIDGMLTRPHMLLLTPLPGRSSRRVSVHITSQQLWRSWSWRNFSH